MFKLETKKIIVLGEELEVRPVPVTKMLEIRAKYDAINENDLPALINLMNESIIDAVVNPKITLADLNQLDVSSLRDLFAKVADASGLMSEKKEGGNTTT